LRGSRVRFSVGAANCSHRRFQNGSWAQPASYSMGTRGCFSGVKRRRREADQSSTEIKEYVELYLHSPSLPPFCGAQLKHGDNFTFTSYRSHDCFLCQYTNSTKSNKPNVKQCCEDEETFNIHILGCDAV